MKKSNILSPEFQDQLKKAKQFSKDVSHIFEPQAKNFDLEKSFDEAFEGEGDA